MCVRAMGHNYTYHGSAVRWLDSLAIKERTALPFLIVLNLDLAYYIASLALNT